MKVLVAEDDENIRNGLMEVLTREGYAPLPARDGQEALDLFRSEAPDFICLDIMMPKINGYDVCRAVRKLNPRIPIVFISAKSEEVDKVLGLELGGDDFIMKPFGVREVVARIRAVTRRAMAARGPETQSPPFRMLDLEVLPAELRARRGKQVIDLSLRDVRLLELFHRNKGRVLDRNTLLDHGWGRDYFPNSRALDQHISQLRKRIERDPKEPAIILTVHGVGYRYDG
ncbi:MAG TPA: response regulator transcription factor [Candidatus Hydrogenedentes bacterium]|nr:response regulator transcription factor [Candidatus Hydrogenedentota bacterium]